MTRFFHLVFAAVAMALIPRAAFAHIGIGSTASFAAGFSHPFSGIDHVSVMIAVGLWAALKGGRALWLWPLAFVGVMVVGGLLGMAHIALPAAEPAILASVVATGLLVALAVDLPVWLGAVVVAVFALFHGHAHGAEAATDVNGVEYLAGFALATATLHLTGLGVALGLTRVGWLRPVRALGAICVAAGLVLVAQSL